MTLSERLAIEARRRSGAEVLVNACPDNMVITPQERHEAAVRMRARREKNIVARGGVARAY